MTNMASSNQDGSQCTVPMTMIAGWLGAGKTTIVNRLITNMMADGLKIAFIQNEFSESGMDKPLLVDQQTGEVFNNFLELAEGCICCSVKNDFVNALDRLLAMHRFDHIILECSGLADPGEVASTLWVDDDLQLAVHLDAVVTVVDGVNILKQLSKASPEEGASLQRQIATADLLIVTKLDLINDSSMRSLTEQIRQINATADLIQTSHGDIDYRQVVNRNAFSTSNTTSLMSVTTSACSHDHSIGALVLGPYYNLSVDIKLLDRWLADILWDSLEPVRKYPWTIFRLKGIVYCKEEKRIHIQAVQQLFDREYGTKPMTNEEKVTKIVVIGRNLDQTLFETGLLQCAT